MDPAARAVGDRADARRAGSSGRRPVRGQPAHALARDPSNRRGPSGASALDGPPGGARTARPARQRIHGAGRGPPGTAQVLRPHRRGACAAQPERPRLIVLGDGDAAPLRAAAAAAHFEGLHIDCVDDVSTHLHAADLYVSASATESFGLANLEAMCAGLPCVLSAVGGVPEVAGSGAWLVSNDTATLGYAIGTLMADEGMRRQWAARARERTSHWPDATETAQGQCRSL